MIAYLIWSALAYAFHRKNITIAAWLIAIGWLIIGNIFGYYPFRVFAVLISSIGFAYGLRLIVKSILLSTEIQKSKQGEWRINGMINVAILTGVLLWSYLWFSIFAKRWVSWFQIIVWFLVTSILLTTMMDYDKHFKKKSFLQILKHSLPNIWGIIKKYVRLLLPIGALRAISTAIGQKMLEIGIDLFQRTPKSWIIIIIISFLGAILGHIISVYILRNKKNVAMIFTIIFWLATIYFPHIINKYEYYITLKISGFFIGVFFGIAVNLLEGRYFFHIGDDHRKEYGSVAYGIMTSIIIFIIMIASDYLNKVIGMKISFFFFGIILLLMPFFIRKFDAPNIPK